MVYHKMCINGKSQNEKTKLEFDTKKVEKFIEIRKQEIWD